MSDLKCFLGIGFQKGTKMDRSAVIFGFFNHKIQKITAIFVLFRQLIEKITVQRLSWLELGLA